MQTPTRARQRQLAVIFLVSLAGLLIEVSYTRIISFKLWYYYTYLVIGLALLGIGSGGVLVSLWDRLRGVATERIMALCGLIGAVAITVSYFVIARIPVNTVKIWDYGSASSIKNLAILGLISFMLFISFVPMGVTVSVILGRAGDRVGTLYFGDLLGAGLGCLVAIPLITILGPPAVVVVAALAFALSGLVASPQIREKVTVANVVVAVVLLGVIFMNSSLPDVRPEETKSQSKSEYFDWGPVFRVDVEPVNADSKLLKHDGSWGSGLHTFQQDKPVTDYRSIPFGLLGRPSNHTLIIGSAGGNEVQASLHFRSKQIEGVELNPVTIGLLKDRYADFTGDLTRRPNVTIHQADGRSFIARSKDHYDLVWYVAPDSYAANNAASSGAFVLSESYLYTVEMIKQTLQHLDDNGIMVVQFGELSFRNQPNRTERYVMTAREAFRQLGIDNPSDHMVIATEIYENAGDLSTIILKRTPFTSDEVSRVVAAADKVDHTEVQYAPGIDPLPGPVTDLAAAGTDAEAHRLAAASDRNIGPVVDNAPFFWHFVGFDSVLRDITRPMDSINPEDSIGERVLLLLLAISVAYAAVFLLAPFAIKARRNPAAVKQPARKVSALYFASLGIGFMLIEISMIQRLTLLLGYPTFSLTVTLASILVFSGIGAALTPRFAAKVKQPLVVLWMILAAMVVVYQVLLDPITDALLPSGLAVRIIAAILMLAPAGLCLGMFMPSGLIRLGHITSDAERSVAWAWAVNGFFSVIGSVSTTILSMTFGFRVVMVLALAVYGIAVLAYHAMKSGDSNVDISERPIDPESDSTESLEPAGV